MLMGREGRIVSHRPKNLKTQIEKEIIEDFLYEEEFKIDEIKTPPIFIEEEVIVEPIVIIEDLEEKDEFDDVEQIEDERVICINTNVIYKNNKEAGMLTGINSGAIKRCCNGDTKSAGKDEEGNKLKWKYLKDL